LSPIRTPSGLASGQLSVSDGPVRASRPASAPALSRWGAGGGGRHGRRWLSRHSRTALPPMETRGAAHATPVAIHAQGRGRRSAKGGLLKTAKRGHAGSAKSGHHDRISPVPHPASSPRVSPGGAGASPEGSTRRRTLRLALRPGEPAYTRTTGRSEPLGRLHTPTHAPPRAAACGTGALRGGAGCGAAIPRAVEYFSIVRRATS